MTKISHNETNPYNARRWCNFTIASAWWSIRRRCRWPNPRWIAYTGCRSRGEPHPAYGERKIPAYEVVKDSVQIMRGCFGGCTFCSITAHEGRIIQSRSQESVLGEIRRMTADPDFKGVISDIGGPTANMYQMRCLRPEVEARCRRLSCVHPTICKLLGTDHGPLVDLMRAAREEPGMSQGAGGLGHSHGSGPPQP